MNILSVLRAPSSLRSGCRLPLVGCFAAATLATACSSDGAAAPGAAPGASAADEALTADEAIAGGTYIIKSGNLALDGGFGHWNQTPAVQLYAAAAPGSNSYQEWTLAGAGTLLNVGMGNRYLVDEGNGSASETTTADGWTIAASGSGFTLTDGRTGKLLTNDDGVLALAAPTGSAAQVWTIETTSGGAPPAGPPATDAGSGGCGGGSGGSGGTTTPDAGAADSGTKDAGSPDSGSSSPDSGTPPPSGNLAQALLTDLAFGIWMPRGNQQNLTYQGTKVYESPAFFAYLASMGVTHIGFSYPYTPCGSSCGDLSFIGTPSTGDGYFTSMIAAGKLAQAAGLKVAYRLTDNLTPGSSDFGATLDAWETSAGKAVAASGLDPDKTLIVPWGEMAGSTNAQCNPLATHGDQVLRAVLPRAAGWVLGVSGAYWASSTVFNGDSSGQSRALVTLANGAVDDQVVYVFDDYPFYDQGLAPSSASFADNAAKWQASHGGAPVLQLELGDWHGQAQYDSDPGNPGAWAGAYLPLAQGAGKYAPLLWDMSSSDGSLNMATLANGSEATLSAAGVSALTAANAYIRQQGYFKTSGR